MPASQKLLSRVEGKRIATELTPAQRLVFDRILAGESAREIGKQLKISPFTVSNHTRAIFEAYGLTQRTKLLAIFVVPPPPSRKKKSAAR